MQLALTYLDLPVHLRSGHPVSDDELLRFCADNEDLRVEREPNGELVIMSPTGGGIGNANAQLTYQLVKWTEEEGSGTAFDSNTGFRLPDGSMRSPDASWVSWERWNRLTVEEQGSFPPLCPEFVVELRSASDSLPDLQHKMREWIRNGAELAWLLDPQRRVVEVYRPGQSEPDLLEDPSSVSGEGPVGGFALDLARIWR